MRNLPQAIQDEWQGLKDSVNKSGFNFVGPRKLVNPVAQSRLRMGVIVVVDVGNEDSYEQV